ncbi:MAG: hypothetical protein JWO46_3357 [Nocardioidaceae bacterium]|nr:hypothetical protein [Nocardioidaceae bacterium]
MLNIATPVRALTSVPDLAATTPAETPAERLAAAARNRADRSMSALAALLAERPELRGVHAPADLAYDAIRWSA